MFSRLMILLRVLPGKLLIYFSFFGLPDLYLSEKLDEYQTNRLVCNISPLKLTLA